MLKMRYFLEKKVVKITERCGIHIQISIGLATGSWWLCTQTNALLLSSTTALQLTYARF